MNAHVFLAQEQERTEREDCSDQMYKKMARDLCTTLGVLKKAQEAEEHQTLIRQDSHPQHGAEELRVATDCLIDRTRSQGEEQIQGEQRPADQ